MGGVFESTSLQVDEGEPFEDLSAHRSTVTGGTTSFALKEVRELLLALLMRLLLDECMPRRFGRGLARRGITTKAPSHRGGGRNSNKLSLCDLCASVVTGPVPRATISRCAPHPPRSLDSRSG